MWEVTHTHRQQTIKNVSQNVQTGSKDGLSDLKENIAIPLFVRGDGVYIFKAIIFLAPLSAFGAEIFNAPPRQQKAPIKYEPKKAGPVIKRNVLKWNDEYLVHADVRKLPYMGTNRVRVNEVAISSNCLLIEAFVLW